MRTMLLLYALAGLNGCANTPVAVPAPNQFELIPAFAKMRPATPTYLERYQPISSQLDASEVALRAFLKGQTKTLPTSPTSAGGLPKNN